MNFQLDTFNVKEYDRILSKGLSKGLGKREDQICIEAAICQVLGLDHGDEPGCVASSVRNFKIFLNDSNWSTPKTRAEGLRNLGLAQLGSLGIINDNNFVKIISEKTIKILIPKLFRNIFTDNLRCLEVADRCEKKGTAKAAYAAANAANAAAKAAANAAVNAAKAANAAANAANTANDEYLILSANLALEILKELKSPGIMLLGRDI